MFHWWVRPFALMCWPGRLGKVQSVGPRRVMLIRLPIVSSHFYEIG